MQKHPINTTASVTKAQVTFLHSSSRISPFDKISDCSKIKNKSINIDIFNNRGYMNIIKYMFYIGLFVTGYNAYAMEQDTNAHNLLVREVLHKKLNDFEFEVNYAALSILDDRDRLTFLDFAYSQNTFDELKKQAEAEVAAKMLLANKQNLNNQLLYTSPTKPSKTLLVDHKRKLISRGNTPPAKRRLFTNSEIEIEQ